jgi:hypothetical protein
MKEIEIEKEINDDDEDGEDDKYFQSKIAASIQKNFFERLNTQPTTNNNSNENKSNNSNTNDKLNNTTTTTTTNTNNTSNQNNNNNNNIRASNNNNNSTNEKIQCNSSDPIVNSINTLLEKIKVCNRKLENSDCFSEQKLLCEQLSLFSYTIKSLSDAQSSMLALKK